MYVAITVVVAGVGLAACGGLAWITARRARRVRAPSFEVTPAPFCRVAGATQLADAWRAAGLVVIERPRAIEVATPDGEHATVDLTASRRIGDAPFTIRSHHAELVHALAALTARELGPLVCWIDGYVHGFDAPDAEPAGSGGSAAAPAGTRVMRSR